MPRTLTTRLVAVALVAVLPALILLVGTTLEQLRDQRRTVEAQTVDVARRLAVRVQSFVRMHEGVLDALAVTLDLTDPAVTADQLRAANRELPVRVQDLTLWDLQGRVVVTSASGDRSEASAGADDAFRQALTGGDFAVGVSRANGGNELTFARLVDGGGQPSGVLAVHVGSESLREFIGQAGAPPDSVTAVLTRSGTVLAGTAELAGSLGSDVARVPELSRALSAGEGIAEVDHSDGVRRLTAITPVGEPDWLLAYGIPSETAFAHVGARLTRNIILSAALLVAVVALAAAGAREASRPLHLLRRDAAALAGGDLGHRSKAHGYTEVDALAVGFNEMAGALEHERRSLQALIDASPLAIVQLDREGLVEVWNPAAVTVFGWRSDEVVGRRVPFVPEDGRAEHEVLIADVLAGASHEGVRRTRSRADGSLVDVEMSLSPVLDPAGEIAGVLLLMADVTDRGRLEEQLRQAQKMEAVGRLAGGVAHDFNNVLAAILGYIELAGMAGIPPRAEEHLGGAIESVRRARDLAGRLLTFARREPPQTDPVDVGDVLRQAMSMLRPMLGPRVKVRLHVDEHLPAVRIDGGQLEQVVLNLAVNAQDAMSDGGTLTIEAERITHDRAYAEAHAGAVAGPYVRLTVTDDGAGMDRATRERAFEPFFTTKPPGQGTGLGLAMVYATITRAGGHLRVYSEPGHGTAVQLHLPAAEPDAITAGEAGKALPAPRAGAGEQLLLVEDEPAIRSVASQLLVAHGYRVVLAEDAEEALRVAAGPGVHVDLLITDVVMPGMTGPQLADRLRRRRPGLRVLYVSGYTRRILQDHADPRSGFLAKPFQLRELLDAVASLLDRPEG